jgi:8-oxo-dGTP pyrophosphatase MutT (NUDIX family)
LLELFQDYYKRWGKFGDFGDLIQLRQAVVDGISTFEVDFIGRAAYHKALLAADILPFFRNKDGQTFLVAIKRKYDPGKGKLALVGGLRDVRKFHFETPAETCLREAGEEIKLFVNTKDEEQLRNQNADSIKVEVAFNGKLITSHLRLIGTYQTSSEEENIFTGLKRVYETTAYALMVDLPEVTEEMIRQELQAKDDAKELVILDIQKNNQLEFGLQHHRVIFNHATSLL